MFLSMFKLLIESYRGGENGRLQKLHFLCVRMYLNSKIFLV